MRLADHPDYLVEVEGAPVFITIPAKVDIDTSASNGLIYQLMVSAIPVVALLGQ